MLKSGTFIRVRADHPDKFLAGKDGMVLFDQTDTNKVVMVFYADRFCNLQFIECVGPELWELNELDLTTIDF